jgi:hypothetical protein
MPDQHPRTDRTDEDALRIAKQIVWEARQRPDQSAVGTRANHEHDT